MKSGKVSIIILVVLLILAVGFLTFISKKKKGEDKDVVIPPPVQTPSPEPTPEETPEPPKPAAGRYGFGDPIAMRLNDKITFFDGLSVQLKAINDSRCQPGVQCIWAGEISADFEISGSTILVPSEVHLGTVYNKSSFSNGYVFYLNGATPFGV